LQQPIFRDASKLKFALRGGGSLAGGSAREAAADPGGRPSRHAGVHEQPRSHEETSDHSGGGRRGTVGRLVWLGLALTSVGGRGYIFRRGCLLFIYFFYLPVTFLRNILPLQAQLSPNCAPPL
jgi:hypothetical protein